MRRKRISPLENNQRQIDSAEIELEEQNKTTQRTKGREVKYVSEESEELHMGGYTEKCVHASSFVLYFVHT